MFFPGMLTWVEERDDLPGSRVNAREISTFVRVASVAGQGEVCGIIMAAVLTGNNVLNLK
jgi:hypothetical protein